MPRTSDPPLLLLDTHVWLWLVGGTSDLSETARAMINGAVAAGRLRIAAISLWEVALLAWRDRIILGKSIGLWLEWQIRSRKGMLTGATERNFPKFQEIRNLRASSSGSFQIHLHWLSHSGMVELLFTKSPRIAW